MTAEDAKTNWKYPSVPVQQNAIHSLFQPFLLVTNIWFIQSTFLKGRLQMENDDNNFHQGINEIIDL
jgi:hypothetical protein